MDNVMFATEGITESERFLCTPGEFARDHLIYLQEMGRLKSIQTHRCVRENLRSYLIFMVVTGSGIIQVNGAEHPLIMGDCVFVDCQQHYEHQSSESDPWELMWVHCNGYHMNAFYELFKSRNDEKEYITIENIDKMKRYFEELLQIQRRQEMMSDLKSSVLVEQIIGLLIEETIYQEENKLHVTYNQIREYINENYQRAALLEKMTGIFKLDAEKLNQGFQKIYGIGIHDYILNRRFNKAKELLRFSIKPVSEVVELSGIRDEGLFHKIFEEHEKMTAEEYRKKWAQWVK